MGGWQHSDWNRFITYMAPHCVVVPVGDVAFTGSVVGSSPSSGRTVPSVLPKSSTARRHGTRRKPTERELSLLADAGIATRHGHRHDTRHQKSRLRRIPRQDKLVWVKYQLRDGRWSDPIKKGSERYLQVRGTRKIRQLDATELKEFGAYKRWRRGKTVKGRTRKGREEGCPRDWPLQWRPEWETMCQAEWREGRPIIGRLVNRVVPELVAAAAPYTVQVKTNFGDGRCLMETLRDLYNLINVGAALSLVEFTNVFLAWVAAEERTGDGLRTPQQVLDLINNSIEQRRVSVQADYDNGVLGAAENVAFMKVRNDARKAGAAEPMFFGNLGNWVTQLRILETLSTPSAAETLRIERLQRSIQGLELLIQLHLQFRIDQLEIALADARVASDAELVATLEGQRAVARAELPMSLRTIIERAANFNNNLWATGYGEFIIHSTLLAFSNMTGRCIRLISAVVEGWNVSTGYIVVPGGVADERDNLHRERILLIWYSGAHFEAVRPISDNILTRIVNIYIERAGVPAGGVFGWLGHRRPGDGGPLLGSQSGGSRNVQTTNNKQILDLFKQQLVKTVGNSLTLVNRWKREYNNKLLVELSNYTLGYKLKKQEELIKLFDYMKKLRVIFEEKKA